MYPLIIFLCYFCILPLAGSKKEYADYKYYNDYGLADYIGITDKQKMMKVAKELIMDAFLKIRQVADIRDDYSSDHAFEIGLIMGNIREKYRRMLETYREMNDKYIGRSFFVPQSIGYMRPVHYIVSMEEVHALEVDIDKSIHILETIKSDKLNPDPRYVTTTTTRRRGPWKAHPRYAGYARAGKENSDDIMIQKEESLKKKNREKQLLRRLGAKAKHTVMPRFKHQWPVEESWRLGQYGDLNRYY